MLVAVNAMKDGGVLGNAEAGDTGSFKYMFEDMAFEQRCD